MNEIEIRPKFNKDWSDNEIDDFIDKYESVLVDQYESLSKEDKHQLYLLANALSSGYLAAYDWESLWLTTMIIDYDFLGVLHIKECFEELILKGAELNNRSLGDELMECNVWVTEFYNILNKYSEQENKKDNDLEEAINNSL